MTIFIERQALLYVLESSSDSSTKHKVPIGEEDEWVEVNRVTKEHRENDDCCCSLAFSDDEESSLDSAERRRVSFSENLISDVHYRPRTPQSDVQKMFYSSEETNRFRQEYRMERKIMMELDMDLDSTDTDLSDLFGDSSADDQTLSRQISRVLILHNDKIETLSEITPSSQEAAIFDNDSFWSGSITWF